MHIRFEKFGFYNIDVAYLRHLNHDVDSNVYYSEQSDYTHKPFIGVLIVLEAYKYFIPLTSRKPKFAFLRQTGSDYFLIFEKVKEKNNNPKEIYREYERNKFIRIFAMLDLKRMIPVPDGVYRRVDFSKETDIRYKSLLVKEYQFCQHIKDAILTKTEKIYSEQKHSGKIHKGYCNFAKLEKACDGYFVVES